MIDDRRELVVTEPWSAEMAALIEQGAVDRLVLNYALGFEEAGLDFLRDLPVRELVVLDRRVTDLEPVYSLAATLELLHLTSDPGIRVDLTRLPELRELRADWAQVEQTIAAVPRLTRAAFRSYQPDDLTPLAPLADLTWVSMKDRPRLRSLTGLSALPKLVDLGVFLAQKLDDISELRGRSNLENLDLQSCRLITSTCDLDGCTSLRRLNLAEGGDLDTAGPLAGLVNLRALHLYGTTTFIDGDLSPIANLPRLAELRMQNRRHYRPSVAEIQAGLGNR